MTRLSTQLAANKLSNRKNLVTFITAGDPSVRMTLKLMHALVSAGVDVIELGVPFSDPMADGPVIQRASERAVANGVGISDVLQLVSEFRSTNKSTPVVLMGYANPIEHMGQTAFIQQAVASGVDGVLVVDYPPEESIEFSNKARDAGLNVIYLVAPTTAEARMVSTARVASGFIYYVSLKGVTGAGNLDVGAVKEQVAKLRLHTDLPINVGFGISDSASARAVAEVADGVVIGSKLITLIENAVNEGQDAEHIVREWTADVRSVLDA
ncbi:tryptophan synthase subunit alpha [Hydromonas duriensis]|uniref:Tryptophan synthase alpha chain n=1 Tax=Hydromonas duriensis TaxID=1527608 RepID=A0A4R6Y2I0_9BURK|nr:tryptophan synthase subunit alpha [Hydromonas duriensis]TDR30517.1 tryptophan synthase alpha chain [Hydromonas duriensis]